MLLRSSKTLVVVPDKDGVICHDFLTKVSVLCEIETLRWLTVHLESVAMLLHLAPSWGSTCPTRRTRRMSPLLPPRGRAF